MLIELAVLGGGATLFRRLQERHENARPGARQREHRSGDDTAATRPGRGGSGAPARPRGEKPGFSVIRLARDLKGAVVAEGRKGLQVDLDPEESQRMRRVEKEAGKRMAISVGAMGMAVLGSTYPVFSLVGIVAVLYLARDLFLLIAKDIRRGHYYSSYLLMAILLAGMIATGHLLLAAVAGFAGSLSVKIINRVEGDSAKALSGVFGGHPEKVWVLVDGVETQVAFHAVQPGDLAVVNAGEVIPVDGCVEEGKGQVDQHLLTGESQPAEKGPGEQVFAATLLLSGRLHIRVQTAGDDTVAAKISQVLNETKGYKDTLTLRGRRIADRYVPLSAGIAALTLPLLGTQAAVTALWANFGGAMAGLGPLSVLSYLQLLSRQGILIKDGRVLELLHQVDTLVFDKTGTLTLDQPGLARIHALDGYQASDVLRLAAGAEQRQPHPIARAILEAAAAQGLKLPALDDASYRVGYGIEVRIEGRRIRVGSARFLADEGLTSPPQLQAIERQAEAESHTLIYVGVDNDLVGVLEMQPTLRPEAQAVVEFLGQRGIEMIIISGDHETPTRRMAETLGIRRYFAETLPEHKADKVRQLREEGRFVCFIGDGINDAIALKSAQVSMSLKGASSAATDTAQIVFMDGTLKQLNTLFTFADEFEQTMKNNLLASFAPAGIIVGGVLFTHLGLAGAMVIDFAGSLAGIGNTLWPLVRHQEKGGKA